MIFTYKQSEKVNVGTLRPLLMSPEPPRMPMYGSVRTHVHFNSFETQGVHQTNMKLGTNDYFLGMSVIRGLVMSMRHHNQR